MRYLTKLKYRKYVRGYSFLSFARKIGKKSGKSVMDTSAKAGIDAAETVSKIVVQTAAEETGDLAGNKTPDKITSIDHSKQEEKTKKVEKIYIPPKKDNKLLMT